jgi:hypothetical protein
MRSGEHHYIWWCNLIKVGGLSISINNNIVGDEV